MSIAVRELGTTNENLKKQQAHFEDQLETRKQQCDDLNKFFHRVSDEKCDQTVYEAGYEVLVATARKLGDENLAQQYELNMLSNYIDKYLPLRMQHQLSNLMHPMLYKATDLRTVYEKYQD